jgi:small-conductance mechanosensitive channel
VISLFTRRTETDVDDQIVLALRSPVVNTIVLTGIGLAVSESAITGLAGYLIKGTLISILVVLWAGAAMRIGSAVLDLVSRHADRFAWIQEKTLPLFDIALKLVVVGGVLYFVCIAWEIPLTSWLTSAGIVGIAVGFAAKDTLANLFSGLFIIADAPYKLGDFIILDAGLRGIVTDIGIRSTRLLTRDDIEVTVPNALIGNAKIINETGGPYEKMRVRVKVSAAYGSDIDLVEEVLLASAGTVEHVSDQPAPRVRFRSFGESGLDFELLAWIDEPVFRGRTLHALNSRVYKAFGEAGIEIPYNKLDVYFKERGPRPAEESAA